MMIRRLAIASLFLVPAVASAQPSQSPTGTYLSAPPAGVTFSGLGIPGPVMSASFGANLGNLLVLGASQRYDNAPLGNDGAGRYFAMPGQDISSSPVAGYARWNFNFFIGGATASDYDYRLFIDHNAAVGNTGHYVLTLPGMPCVANAQLGVTCNPTRIQNSWNLGMDLDLNGGPTGSFDVNAGGEYTFTLAAFEKQLDPFGARGREVSRVAIAVSTVPEPSTYVLMTAGLIGILALSRRRRTV